MTAPTTPTSVAPPSTTISPPTLPATITTPTAGPTTAGLTPSKPGVKVAEKPYPDFLEVLDRLTLLLIGLTGAGKTTQIGQLAKYLKFKKGLKTRLITVDRGGHESINHLIPEFIEPVYYKGSGFDPFVFLDRTIKGQIPVNGKWIDGRRPDIGLYAFDSASSIGEEMAQTMRDSQNTASPIGPKAYNFTIGEQGTDNTVAVGTLDKGHFGIMQERITEAMWRSFDLPGHVLWTAVIRRIDQDDETKAPLLGPELAGKALTGTAPRWFKYTWALVKDLPLGGGLTKHFLHLEGYRESTMAMTPVVGNVRTPLDGADGAPIPAVLEPASIVKALALIARRQVSARDAMKTADPQAEIKKLLGL